MCVGRVMDDSLVTVIVDSMFLHADCMARCWYVLKVLFGLLANRGFTGVAVVQLGLFNTMTCLHTEE